MVEREINEEMRMTASTPTATLRRPESMRYWIALLVAVGSALLALWSVGADSASAKSEIFGYRSEPTTTQAGGHPDIVTEFELGSRLTQEPSPCFCNDPKDVILHAPAGVIANPHVVSECAIADLALFKCPADSQAGIVVLRLFGYGILPLYRTPPQKGQAGLFAFALPFGISVPQYIVFNARTGSDYGLDIKTVGISHILPLLDYGPVFWGIPGDPRNDVLRFVPGKKFVNCDLKPFDALLTKDPAIIKKTCSVGTNTEVPTSLPIAPLTQNPTTCSGPLTSSIETLAYDKETDHAEGPWPATTGCDALSFDPSLAANPTTTQTDTASGLEVDLRVPQFQDPNTPSPSELRANTVTLPEGFSINPGAADGKASCSDFASRIGTELEAACPEFSKVGTVTVDSSALPAPIDGYIYVGEPKPGDPYRLILTANGFGTAVKLAGSVRANPQTGQLVTEFKELPQTPFQRFVLHFFGSERGLLATPTHCGTYAVKSTFTPWASEISEQTSTQFFTLDSGPGGSPCPAGARPFQPRFEAGSQDNTAGVHSTFNLRLTRDDGDQNLTGVNVTTPPGFAAILKGVPYCPPAALEQLGVAGYTGVAEQTASPCPAASQIGSATAGAGAGTHPVYVDGKVYLAGPYKGAPLSLIVVVPAVSGPYDLGVIAVRVAINVDPTTAQVTAVSDTLPKILAGVPLRTRFIQVNLDRPDFALNPTNCDPFSVNAAVAGGEGAVSGLGAHFQAANCTDLGFAPKLGLKLRGSTKRRGHPALRTVLMSGPGEANLARATVVMPKNVLLDNAHIGTVCTNAQFAANSCPAASVYGSATAETPLLDQPLSGPVYLRSSRHKLPDLVADLHGQIDIELVGRIDSVKRGGLRTRFETLPDAPVSKFVLDMKGGKKGLLINSKSLCKSSRKASVNLVGQNGAQTKRRTRLQTACGSKASRHKRHYRRLDRSRAVG